MASSIVIKQLANCAKFQKKLGKKTWAPWSKKLDNYNCVTILSEASKLDPETHMACHGGRLFQINAKIPLNTIERSKWKDMAHTFNSHVPRVTKEGTLMENQRLIDIYFRKDGMLNLDESKDILLKLEKDPAVVFRKQEYDSVDLTMGLWLGGFMGSVITVLGLIVIG